jgi:hypothetical protein
VQDGKTGQCTGNGETVMDKKERTGSNTVTVSTNDKRYNMNGYIFNV